MMLCEHFNLYTGNLFLGVSNYCPDPEHLLMHTHASVEGMIDKATYLAS